MAPKRSRHRVNVILGTGVEDDTRSSFAIERFFIVIIRESRKLPDVRLK